MTGQDLAIQRRSLGYTQAELAELMHTSRATVNRWENMEKPVEFLVVSFMLGLTPKGQVQP